MYQQSQGRFMLWQEDVSRLAKEYGVELIGDGVECAVVSVNGESRHVVALRYKEMSPEYAKETYYLQRILSTLFPYNFPHFHASFSGDNKNEILPGTIRQKIEKSKHAIAKYPFGQVLNQMTRMGIREYISMDTSDFNFQIAPDGGQYFLDTPKVNEKLWDKELFTIYMRNNLNQEGQKYSQKDIKLVQSSIDRLQNLGRIKFLF